MVGKRLVGKRLVGQRLVGQRLVGRRLVGRELVDRGLVDHTRRVASPNVHRTTIYAVVSVVQILTKKKAYSMGAPPVPALAFIPTFGPAFVALVDHKSMVN